jgi:DNA-binding response OmpR family regulator
MKRNPDHPERRRCVDRRSKTRNGRRDTDHPAVRTRSILVVEDDADSRTMLAAFLASQGYRVLTAANGEEGLALTRQHRPSLVLLDLMMPVMDGEQFLKQQRADVDIQQIPVVIVSARGGAAGLALQLGACGYLPKPVDFDELCTCVARLCLQQS